MEFNAGIFSFTGTRKSPLNIFQLRELTRAQSRNSGRAGGVDGVRFDIFPRNTKGWSRLELSLT
jgi:hypothetical protein